MDIWNGEIMPIDLLKHGENKNKNETEISLKKERINI